jgi:tetratricopeptide (TPR) repeat protein
LDAAQAYARALIDPVQDLPAPELLPQPEIVLSPASQTVESAIAVSGPTPLPQASPTALPSSVSLAAPSWEKQDWNNCGPATLGLYLRFYGWEGDQFSISDEIKPERSDRNVNVDELIYYAQNWAGWLNSQFRVGGDIELLKAFLAAGIPVMVEEGYILEESYWPNDDRWAGHYLLLTGYDDGAQTFTAQDTFVGPNQVIGYEELDVGWQQFNRVYLIAYLPHQEEAVRGILRDHWDEDFNREAALETSREETISDPENAYVWFNLGMNLVYLERYGEAATAFDSARSIGLPQRMLRYQFGPFFAYYNANRLEDLDELVDYALRITDVSEEVIIWKGWAYYRQGDSNGAIEQFRLAYETNPKSVYAQQALDFMGVGP